MKTCAHCGKSNPDDASYCYQCGNRITSVTTSTAKKSFWARLPSWAWIFIGLAALGLFLLLIIGGFWSVAHLEGFASLILLVIGIFAFRVFSGHPPVATSLVRAIGIGFFALMGATIDQPGNMLYNQPVEWTMCPADTKLERSTITSHPLPGRTDMTQHFTCTQNGKTVKQVNMFAVIGIGFLEYMLLAYALLGLRWLIWKWKTRQQASPM